MDLDDKKSTAITTKHLSPNCSVCHEAIEGGLFQCFQCEGDYNMCGSCVTSGKHPDHNIIIRFTDSKVYFYHYFKVLVLITSIDYKILLTN